MKQVIQTFSLGRSVVATMPKFLGIKPGTKLKVQRLKDSILLRPAKTEKASALVDKLKGGLNFKKVFGKTFTLREINKIIDEQYKDMLSGR